MVSFLISLAASILTVVGIWVKDLLILRRAAGRFTGTWDQYVPDRTKLSARPVPLIRDLGNCVVTITRKAAGVVHLHAIHSVDGQSEEHVWEGDGILDRQQHNQAVVPWKYTKTSVGSDSGVYTLFLHDDGTLLMYSAVPPLPGDHPKFMLRRTNSNN